MTFMLYSYIVKDRKQSTGRGWKH